MHCQTTQLRSLNMFFVYCLHSHHMPSFQGSVDNDQERSEIFVEGVGADRCSSQDAEQLTHPLFSYHGQVQISAVDLGYGLLNQSRPQFHSSLIFTTVNEQHLLPASDGLDGDKVVNDNITPGSILAEGDVVGAIFCGLLVAEEGKDPHWFLSQDRQSRKEVGIGVFTETEEGGFTGIDQFALAVVYSGQSLKFESFFLIEYLPIEDYGPSWGEVVVYKAAAEILGLSYGLFCPFLQGLSGLEGRVVSSLQGRHQHQVQLVIVQPPLVLDPGWRLLEVTVHLVLLVLGNLRQGMEMADFVYLYVHRFEHQRRVFFKLVDVTSMRLARLLGSLVGHTAKENFLLGHVVTYIRMGLFRLAPLGTSVLGETTVVVRRVLELLVMDLRLRRSMLKLLSEGAEREFARIGFLGSFIRGVAAFSLMQHPLSSLGDLAHQRI